MNKTTKKSIKYEKGAKNRKKMRNVLAQSVQSLSGLLKITNEPCTI